MDRKRRHRCFPADCLSARDRFETCPSFSYARWVPAAPVSSKRPWRGALVAMGATVLALTYTGMASATLEPPAATDPANASRVPSGPIVGVAPASAGASALPGSAGTVTTRPVRYQLLPLVRPARGGKTVYLTFDDGPNRLWTPRILGLLKRYHAKATFFVIGRNVRNNPAIVTAMARAGHSVQNHTNTHPDLRRIRPDGLLAERQLRPVNSLIQRLTGHVARCLRPPYGSYDLRVRRIAGGLGLRIAMWTVDTRDWQHPGMRNIIRAGSKARGGSIVLMHDGVGGRQTYNGLNHILANLTARGFVFKTLC